MFGYNCEAAFSATFYSPSMADSLKPIVLYPEDGSFSPPLTLEILPHGLTLNKILINGDGKTHDIVVGPYILEDVGSSNSRNLQC